MVWKKKTDEESEESEKFKKLNMEWADYKKGW